MIRVVILGQGMAASHLAVGLERIKRGEIQPYGIPLAQYNLPYRIEDIEIVASYDVDEEKIGKSLYDISKKLIGEIDIPPSLRDVYVRRGIHLGSLKDLPFKPSGLEDNMSVNEAVETLIDEWKNMKVDVIVNIITTEYGDPFNNVNELKYTINMNLTDRLTASQVYAYAGALYSSIARPAAFVNGIPTPLANDDAIVGLYEESGGVILGDDGATGATPLTADLLEHMAERGRKVRSIAQFNIGGNTDFLALTIPSKNIMKEKTKSSIVEDILGYDAPHYIKPTGYLEPLGDKKFVAMHMEYISFNGYIDELYVIARINDSPALAGSLIDLIRLSKIALDGGHRGTIYPINAFFMKKPGPRNSKSTSKITAFYKLLEWLRAPKPTLREKIIKKELTEEE